MLFSQCVERKRSTWLAGLVGGLLAMAVLFAGRPAAAADFLYVSGGYLQPLGTSSDFADPGTNVDVRWRHFNRGRTAYELSFGYAQAGLGGVIQTTIDDFEQLVRTKNQLAQLQGGPGRGRMVAEFGILEVYHLDFNILYRFSKRSRLGPFVSVGGGLYNWRVPFRVKFFDVPSFGEQRPWEPVFEGQVYAFVHDEQAIDFTKHQNSGGLNLAVGTDLRVSASWRLDVEVRSHLIFSSGTGNREEGADDQDYLDNMTLLMANAGLKYRF